MSKKIYLGVDIGGTYVRMIMLRGLKPHKPAVFKIRSEYSKKKLEALLRRHIDPFLGNEKGHLAGVGVSIAGIVDARRGVLVRVHNIPSLNGWNIKKFFAYLGAPVRVDNDARCFLISEMKWGAGQKKKNIVGVAIGTGIGGAIVVDGKMYRGSHHAAGEAGFMIMGEHPRKFFEDLAGMKAYQKFGERSRVRGLGIASIINTLDPEIVILGGGAAEAKDFYLKKIIAAARANTTNPLARKIPIVRGVLGEGAQAVGAALLFAEK